MNRDDRLDALFEEARAEMKGRADRGGRVRDFAAMIARAHAIDPAAVPRAAVEEAAEFAPVVVLRRGVEPVSEPSSPPVAAPIAASPRARRFGWLAAAAGIVLLLGGLAGAVRMASSTATTTDAHAVPLVGPAPSESGEATPGEPPAPRRTPRGGRAVMPVDRDMSEEVEVQAGEPAAAEGQADDPDMLEGAWADEAAAAVSNPGEPDMPGKVQGDEAAATVSNSGDPDMSEKTRVYDAAALAVGRAPSERATPGVAPRTVASRTAAHGSPGERALPRSRAGDARTGAPAVDGDSAWATLDRSAREAWRRGDLAEARALLGALVRSDAGSARVEMAYGDLFVLTRQADDAAELARLWRGYLARFPRGLYAEDARAGLCRREKTAACWQRYLADWPAGAHADEARDAVERP